MELNGEELKKSVTVAEKVNRLFVPFFLLCASPFVLLQIVRQYAGVDQIAFDVISIVIAAVCVIGLCVMLGLLMRANGKIKRLTRKWISDVFRSEADILEGESVSFAVAFENETIVLEREDGKSLSFDLTTIKNTAQFAYTGNDILLFLQAYYGVNLQKGNTYGDVSVTDRISKKETVIPIVAGGKLCEPLKANPFIKEV